MSEIRTVLAVGVSPQQWEKMHNRLASLLEQERGPWNLIPCFVGEAEQRITSLIEEFGGVVVVVCFDGQYLSDRFQWPAEAGEIASILAERKQDPTFLIHPRLKPIIEAAIRGHFNFRVFFHQELKPRSDEQS